MYAYPVVSDYLHMIRVLVWGWPGPGTRCPGDEPPRAGPVSDLVRGRAGAGPGNFGNASPGRAGGPGRGDFFEIISKNPPPRGAKRPGGGAEGGARGYFQLISAENWNGGLSRGRVKQRWG